MNQDNTPEPNEGLRRIAVAVKALGWAWLGIIGGLGGIGLVSSLIRDDGRVDSAVTAGGVLMLGLLGYGCAAGLSWVILGFASKRT